MAGLMIYCPDCDFELESDSAINPKVCPRCGLTDKMRLWDTKDGTRPPKPRGSHHNRASDDRLNAAETTQRHFLKWNNGKKT